MDCEDCAHAARNHIWGGYQRDCDGCRIRMFAAGPMFHDCERERRILPQYRRALQSVYGDGWRAAHERVKAQKINIMKGNDAAND